MQQNMIINNQLETTSRPILRNHDEDVLRSVVFVDVSPSARQFNPGSLLVIQ
jgi:hypothetical protein